MSSRIVIVTTCLGLSVLVSPLLAQTSATTQAPAAKVENPFPDRVKVPDGILDGGKGWLNTSGPISLKDLRGKIVVLDFWTYCCINCMHVLPDLKYLEQKYPNELVVIGVHSAKFTNEKDSENIRQAIMRYEIEHPVINDADMTVWRKFGARSWPTLAIIDPEGFYCGAQPGEGHRELFDAIVGQLVKYHRDRKTLDESPIKFNLEREKAEPTPLRYPGKVLSDEAGKRIFIADTGNNRIVIAGADGSVQSVIGNGAVGLRDGSFEEAEFDHPQGMSLVDGKQLYVADTENHCIRMIDLEKKTVSTIAGTGKQSRSRDKGGPAKTTALNSPWAIQHLDGILFIAMAGPHQLWQHVIGGDEISVYAGSGVEDVVNGALATSAMAQPSGIASDGNWLYVADSEGSAIRKVATSSDGDVTTIAGTSELARGQSLFAFGDKDGIGKDARLQHPLGVALKGDTLFVADSYNHKIKKIDLKTAAVSSWLGNGIAGDGVQPAQFSEPGGLAIQGQSLLIADTNNHRICAADIKSGKITVLPLTGLKPPTPPKRSVFGELKPIVLEAQNLKAAEQVAVELTLDIPEGYKINKEMPVVWQATNVGEGLILKSPASPAVNRTSAEKQKVRIQVPLTPGKTQGQVQLSVRYGYCRDGVGGLCKMTTKSWRIPIVIAPEGAQKITIPAS